MQGAFNFNNRRSATRSLRVLVACEFSGTVRNAFLDRGHDAWSCDLLPAEDGSNRHHSSILCGTFSVAENNNGDKLEWESKYPVAANLFYRLVKEHNPDFVAIERPEHGVRQFKKKGATIIGARP